MADEVRKLSYSVELTFIAPLAEQQRLAAERLRTAAMHIESIPTDVFAQLLVMSGGQPTGGCLGAPYENGDFKTGWKGLWSVREVKE